jgi:hypothetical protein
MKGAKNGIADKIYGIIRWLGVHQLVYLVLPAAFIQASFG